MYTTHRNTNQHCYAFSTISSTLSLFNGIYFCFLYFYLCFSLNFSMAFTMAGACVSECGYFLFTISVNIYGIFDTGSTNRLFSLSFSLFMLVASKYKTQCFLSNFFRSRFAVALGIFRKQFLIEDLCTYLSVR